MYIYCLCLDIETHHLYEKNTVLGLRRVFALKQFTLFFLATFKFGILIMDSMLNIKSDLDPFELYDMKNFNEDVEDIQSARIKLAVLKVQYILGQ